MTDHISTVTFTAEDLTRLIKVEAWAKEAANTIYEEPCDDDLYTRAVTLGLIEAQP